MMRCFLISLFAISALFIKAQNPIPSNGFYIADPTARVWDDGSLYIYGSLDESCDYYCSKKYHVLYTEDLKNWKVVENVFTSEGENDGVAYNDNLLFAPSSAFRDGHYYLYYCQPDRDNAEGVAISDSPTGPFQNAMPVNTGDFNEIDPDVFIDDDGTAYYCWGQFSLKLAKLNPDMISLDSTTIQGNILTEDEHHFHEGAFMCKIRDLYYLVYADISRGDAPTCLGYATSNNPFGPYTYRGVIIDNDNCNPNNWNNHGSIASYDNQYYVFYHRSTHGCNKMRKTCVEPIEILEDGSIPEVEMSSQGASGPLNAKLKIEAEWACLLSGNARIAEFEDAGEGEGEGIIGIGNSDKIAFKNIDFSMGADSVVLRLNSNRACGKLLISLDKPWHNRLALIDVSDFQTESWEEISFPVENVEGVHALWLHYYSNEDNSFEIDWIKFK